jgi:hypothetical protein
MRRHIAEDIPIHNHRREKNKLANYRMKRISERDTKAYDTPEIKKVLSTKLHPSSFPEYSFATTTSLLLGTLVLMRNPEV